MTAKGLVQTLSALSVLAAAMPMAHAQTATSTTDPAAFIQKWDRSGKGLLDLKGVLNAAIVKFEMLDTAHKGRLTQDALAPIVSAQEFAVANPDGDTTIGAEEWFDLVRRHFNAANPDNDGSLTADELTTPAGQALVKLLN